MGFFELSIGVALAAMYQMHTVAAYSKRRAPISKRDFALIFNTLPKSMIEVYGGEA